MALQNDFAETLIELCEKSLNSSSNQPAVEYYGIEKDEVMKKDISYKELNYLVKKLHSAIVKNTEEKQVIGIHLDPSIELVISILSSLKAKLVFVPLEITPNIELFAKIIGSVGLKHILSSEKSYTSLINCLKHLHYEARILVKIPLHAGISDLVFIELRHETTRQFETCKADLAYIVHTSGTTGLPKLVAVPHQCIIPNIVHLSKLFDAKPTCKIALMSPPTFDPSIVELFMAIANHATLVIPSTNIKMSPQDLGKVLFDRGRVTILQATPAVLKRFSIEYLRNNVFCDKSSLQVMAFGGEVCPSYKTIKSWLNPDCAAKNSLPNQYFNIYGITEVSSWATCHKLSSNKILSECDLPVPLGYPLLKTDLQIRCEASNSVLLEFSGDKYFSDRSIDDALDGIPIDSSKGSSDLIGKLYIGGDDRISYILGENVCPYHYSGDIVKILFSSGKATINFMGRSDAIIKRNGKKLNLEAIEKKLLKTKDVQSSHIITVQSKLRDVQILAFLVRNKSSGNMSGNTEILLSNESTLWSLGILKEIAKDIKVADLPDRILEVSNIPITPHGKVDEILLRKLYSTVISENLEDSILGFEEVRSALSLILPIAIDAYAELSTSEADYQIDMNKTFTQMGGSSFGAVLVIGWLERFIRFSLFEKIPHIFDILLKESLKVFIEKIINRDEHRYSECVSEGLQGHKHKLVDTSCYGSKYFASEFLLAISRGGQYQYNSQDTMRSGNASETETRITGVTPHIRQLWKYNTGKCVDASPLVACIGEKSSVCYIGSHSHLFSCVSSNDGTLLWSRKLPDRIESSACFYKSDEGEFVTVGCYDYNVYTFLASSGEVHWTFGTGAEVKSSPKWAQETGLVYIGSHDGYLYALDIKRKECQWKVYCSGGAVFSSPAFFSATKNHHYVFAATLQGRLLCLCGETGKQMWSFVAGRPIFSSPCVNEFGICFGCVDNCVYFLNLDGNVVWRFPTDQPVFSSPCLSSARDGILIGSHDGHLYKLNAKDGSMLWKISSGNGKCAVYSTPFSICLNDRKMGYAIFASTSGHVYVATEEGKTIAKVKLPGEIFSSAVVAPVYEEDETNDMIRVLIGCRDDFLYCLRVSGLQY